MPAESEVFMNLKAFGIVRGGVNAADYGGGSDASLSVNSRGELLVAQALPEEAEIVRLGKSWIVKNTTGVVGQSALPTTTGDFMLYNGNPVGGASLVVSRIMAWTGVADATQYDQHLTMYCLNPAGVPTAPTDATNAKQNLAGRTATYDGAARVALSQTITNNGWFPIGANAKNGDTAANSIWVAQEANVYGRIIVPPTGALNLSTIVVGAQAAVQMFYAVSFHELKLVLG